MTPRMTGEQKPPDYQLHNIKGKFTMKKQQATVTALIAQELVIRDKMEKLLRAGKEKEGDRAGNERFAVENQILKTPSRSLAEVLAKADFCRREIVSHNRKADVDSPDSYESHEDLAYWSLYRDLAALAKKHADPFGTEEEEALSELEEPLSSAIAVLGVAIETSEVVDRSRTYALLHATDTILATLNEKYIALSNRLFEKRQPQTA
jgi:hypothetical protein